MACNGGGGSDPQPAKVAHVEITPTQTTVNEGGTAILTAVAYDSAGDTVTAHLTWTSSDPTVATVEGGVVLGVRAGAEARITAQAGDIKSEPARVSVLPPVGFAGFSVQPATLYLAEGESQALRGVATNENGQEMPLTVVWGKETESDGITVDYFTGEVTAGTEGGPYQVNAWGGGHFAYGTVYVGQGCEPWDGSGHAPHATISDHRALQVVTLADPDLPLTTNRSAVLRFAVQSDAPAPAGIQSRVRVHASIDGRNVGSFESGTKNCLPAGSPDIDAVYYAYDVILPSENLNTGQLEYWAELELYPERGGEPTIVARYPAAGTLRRAVIEPSGLAITFVPVAQQELVPDFLPEDTQLAMADTARLFPIGTVSSDVRAPIVHDGVFSAGIQGLSEANLLVLELWLAESPDPARHYHGILHQDVAPGGGQAALGGKYGVTVLGAERGAARAELRLSSGVIAHELGHNFGLTHAPCGEPPEPDEAYPYPGGVIGLPGFDHDRHRPMPADTFDLMSYCWPRWISSYNYERVLQVREPQAEGTLLRAAQAPKAQVMIITGTVRADGKVELRPVFTLESVPKPPTAGDWRVQLLDRAGTVVSSVNFEPHPLSAEGAYAFGFTLPAEHPEANEVRVLDPSGAVAAKQTVLGMEGIVSQATVQPSAARLPDGRLLVTWDTATTAAALVRDPRTGLILGRGTSGRIALPFAGTSVELILSDGVRSSSQVLIGSAAP